VAQLIAIEDLADPRLSDFRDLMGADRVASQAGVVIAEGVNVVARLLDSPYPIRAILGEPHRIAALEPLLAALDVPVFSVGRWALSDIVGFRVTRGILASADRVVATSLDDVLASANRIVVLQALNDAENLGALFRNAAAFGVDAVLLDQRCADPLYRRSVRVSMGHALRVPFVVTGDLPELLIRLDGAGITTLALSPHPDGSPLRDLETPSRWAVLLGAEGPGLTPEVMARASRRIRIPMATGVDSLNVATAGAVAFAHLTG
jgi:tRNA G18 (ribose-2'-O)-methylase SpoU